MHVIDLVPTLLEAASVASRPAAGTFGPDARAAFSDDGGAAAHLDSVPPLEGVSFYPLMLNNPAASGQQSPGLAPRPLFWEHLGRKAVRVGRWKLVAPSRSDWELYDMDEDRAEQNNLAAQKVRQLANMVQLWDSWAACSTASENNPYLMPSLMRVGSASCTEQAVAALPANEWCSVHGRC